MLDLSVALATFPTLETERLLLRALTADDTADVFRIMGDPRVTRYFGSLPMTTLSQAAERIESCRQSFADHSGVRWAIVERASARMLGSAGYWRLVRPHFSAEIGYELAPEAWGRGIMTEAMRAILRFGFTTLGLHRVEAQIHPDNTGSRRVLEKLGFTQEGYFRQSYYEPATHTFSDTAFFSLLAADWARHADA